MAVCPLPHTQAQTPAASRSHSDWRNDMSARPFPPGEHGRICSLGFRSQSSMALSGSFSFFPWILAYFLSSIHPSTHSYVLPSQTSFLPSLHVSLLLFFLSQLYFLPPCLFFLSNFLAPPPPPPLFVFIGKCKIYS